MMAVVPRGLTYQDGLFWLQVALIVSILGGFTLLTYKVIV